MKLAEATKSPTIMAANKELFDMLGSGTYGGSAEFLQKEIFDTVTFATADVTNAVKTFSFFDPSRSAAKTKADTNLQTNQLPKGQHLSTQVLMLQAYRSDATAITQANLLALIQALQSSYMTVSIQGKAASWDGPLSRILGLSLSAVGQEGSANNIIETFRMIANGNYVLNIPIVLEQLTTFNIDFSLTNAPTADLVGWSLRLSLSGGFVRAS